MTVVAMAKYCDSRSRTSSASRVSDSVVNPTRSPNKIVVSRRSATRWAGSGDELAAAGAAAGGAVVAATTFPTGAPQSPQNRLPGSTAAPQEEQVSVSACPQSPQKRFPSVFSLAHDGHVTATPALPSRGTAHSTGGGTPAWLRR